MKLWSKSTFVALVSTVLAVALIQPVVAGPVQVPAGLGWVKTAGDPGAVLDAIASHPTKLPPEFKERLKYVLEDGTLQVMVALNRRDATVESFMKDNTTWMKWYGDAPRFLGQVTPDQFASLLDSSTTDFVEPDYRIKHFLSTSTLDVHARSLNSAGNGVWSFDPAGGPMGSLRSDIPGVTAAQATGKGVTVQITDSGIDKTFRDFGGWDCEAGPYQPCESRITKAISVDQLVETGADPSDSAPTTEAASGHGTHVAGIIGGNGYYTRDGDIDTRYGADNINFGVAPEANLISVKNGDTLWAGLSSFALQWTLDHAEEYGIRVSSNSWGVVGGSSYNGNSADAQLYRDLYNAGVVVTFAAGNDGGGADGAAFSGNAQSPYTLGVASYDDTNHLLASSSSRGVGTTTLADPATWTPQGEPTNGVRRPDVAAPGVSIWSAGTLTGGAASVVPRVGNGGDVVGGDAPGATVPYRQMSGTSMATPHVSGAAALLFGVCPTAEPLDVMRAIMAGADPADVKATDGSRNAQPYEAGYGALEIRRSADWLLARGCDSGNPGGGGPTPTETSSPSPTPTATETVPTETTRYFFHSLSTINAVDQAFVDGASFDDKTPTFTDDSQAIDVPFQGNAGSGGAPDSSFDPLWTGSISGPINQLTVDFWQQVPEESAQTGKISYDVSVWNGDTEIPLPNFEADVADPTVVSQVTHTFTGLDIDPGTNPISIQIRPHFLNAAIGAIFFDSVAHPSGFSVGTGQAPSPSTSPTSSPTGTPPPPPSGTRGTYPLAPNDPLFADQWGMDKINAPDAWQETQATGYGVNVAILDTGLDLGHPEFACPGKVKVIGQSDFTGANDGPQDGNGHGTHVAGIIGACTNNNQGVVGVAPDSTIMPIQVLDAAGSGDVGAPLANAIRAATDAGAHVINMSLGTLPVVAPIDIAVDGLFPEVDEAVEYATSHGVVVVAAAGNESFPICSYPAIVEDIVCVGATDRNDLNAYYGNFPVNDDDEDVIGAGLVAPGGQGTFCEEGITSTYLRSKAPVCYDPGYESIDGTSMATPHVVGAAALVYDRLGGIRSEENGREVINALINSTDDLYTPGYDPMSGYGRLNALKAVQSVDPVVTTPVAVGTSTAFTDASATAGQFSDTATVAARLNDASGEPISGEELAFEMTGLNGSKSWTAVTDELGVASKEIDLDAAPDSYSLTARYAGRVDELEPSADLGSFVIEKEDTVVSFAAGSATAGQFSDTAGVRAKVTDDDGHALSGVDLVFDLADGASVPATSTTDADGIATTSLSLQGKAGSYDLIARYAESDYYNLGQTTSAFTIGKEDAKTVLTVAGSSSSRTFSAKVTEVDGGTGLAGVVVQFLQNGKSVGTATTNANGVATLASPPKYNKKDVFEAVFAGNAYYLRAGDSYQEK